MTTEYRKKQKKARRKPSIHQLCTRCKEFAKLVVGTDPRECVECVVFGPAEAQPDKPERRERRGPRNRSSR